MRSILQSKITRQQFSGLGFLLLLAIGIFPACRSSVKRGEVSEPARREAAAARTSSSSPAAKIVHPEIGFRTRQKFAEHYQKHGHEFGSLSKEEYLQQAQAVRDAPVGGDILEVARGDRTISRFDRQSGIFIAFDHDLTIRTCFKPNDGERYFKRQLNKEH